MLTINEIFHSIQGESTHTGRPCVFVRLTACDLRCSWCDTPYAFHEGRKMSVDQVVADVAAFECPVVEITGGEPLLQPDVYPLMSELARARPHRPARDRRPSQHRTACRRGVIRIIDVKCPAQRRVREERLVEPRSADADRRGEVRDPGSRRLRVREGRHHRHALDGRCAAVLFSPVHGVLPGKDLAAWILADRLPVRLQLQAHKYIWSADTRGV